MQEYLGLLEKFNISPNFWCSQEYFERARLTKLRQKWHVIMDPDWGPMFPPIHEQIGLLYNSDKVPSLTQIWSDFPHYELHGAKPKFLDHEFIYRPSDFLEMEGGNWAVFRKNCRKFPKRLGGSWSYERKEVYKAQFGENQFEKTLSNLMIIWLDSLENMKVQDDKVLVEYLDHGKNCKVLYDSGGTIFGANIWDFNYKYINFRFSISVRENFAGEFLRWLFYTDPEILTSGKLVNDGGSLGNQKLYDFKVKLNPVSIREVKSWLVG